MVSLVAVNKKAAGYIAYILMVLMTVAIATSLILWGKSTAERQTTGTVNLASGRLECRDIKIDAAAGPGCNSVILSNKGLTNVHHARVAFDSLSQADSGELLATGEKVTVDYIGDNIEGFSNADILPIIHERGNLFGCVDKKLIVKCS